MRIDLEIDEFVAVMKSLGVPCEVTEVIEVRISPPAAAAAGPVQGPAEHTIKNEVMGAIPEKKQAAAPSPGLKKKKDGYQSTPAMLIKCPHCERSMDRRSLHGHIRKGHTDLYKKDEVSRYIKGGTEITIQGIDQDLLQAVPEVRPRTRSDLKDPPSGPAPGPADEFRGGVHVKTTQMFEGILSGTIGTVRKRLGKNYEVNFGRPGYRTIPAGFLVSV